MEKIKVFLLGMLAMLALAVLLGVNGPGAGAGRYQGIAAATYGQPYYWIIDTTTGEIVSTNHVPEPVASP